MKTNLLMNFSVDKENKKINVEREFAASLPKVWAAWTESEILDQWWAPKPWKARTKFMDFSVGGYWLYAMLGPDGSEQWCRADYKSITPLQNFTGLDAFCNEEGVVTEQFPGSLWKNEFRVTANATVVHVEIQYKTLSDLEKIIEMGFKEGFTAALENLDELLKS